MDAQEDRQQQQKQQQSKGKCRNTSEKTRICLILLTYPKNCTRTVAHTMKMSTSKNRLHALLLMQKGSDICHDNEEGDKDIEEECVIKLTQVIEGATPTRATPQTIVIMTIKVRPCTCGWRRLSNLWSSPSTRCRPAMALGLSQRIGTAKREAWLLSLHRPTPPRPAPPRPQPLPELTSNTANVLILSLSPLKS